MSISDGVQQPTRTKNATMAHNRADRASAYVFPKCIQRQSVKAQRRVLVKATVALLGLVPASPNCSSSS